MERGSPPTERVLRVLELLAARPREGLTVSTLARRLDLSKATTLGIVNALTTAGYLVRDERTKTYTLGSALLTLGRAASEAFTSLEFARPAMERLSAELGLAVSISTVVDDKIVLLERCGSQRSFDRMIQAGQRYPYMPPSGLVFAAWLGDDGIEQWLAEYPEVSMEASLPHLHELVDTSRKRGYWIERLSDVSVSTLTVLAGLDGHDIPPAALDAIANMVSNLSERHYVARDLRPGRTFAITFVTAPTFDPAGRPDLMLGLSVFRDDVTYDELVAYGEAAREAAYRVTELSGGRDPWRGRHVPRCRVGRSAD